MRKTILIIAVLLISGCSSSNDAQKALKAAGYTDIQTHGKAFFACSKDDTFATKFSATNSKGERVSGAVCSGWLKGSTIRFN